MISRLSKSDPSGQETAEKKIILEIVVQLNFQAWLTHSRFFQPSNNIDWQIFQDHRRI